MEFTAVGTVHIITVTMTMLYSPVTPRPKGGQIRAPLCISTQYQGKYSETSEQPPTLGDKPFGLC